ncbi:MAG: dual specificity protein phosphatase [Candidatus Dormiibacterota bacterium]
MLRRRPDAVRVIPGLWMGSAPGASQAARLARDGVDSVVDLREEGADVVQWPAQVVVRHFPLMDHGTPTLDQLRDLAAAVSGFVSQGREVLVHCQAGVERTPTVVCAALVTLGWSLPDAYQRVLEVRPESAPTDGQLATLRALAHERSAEHSANLADLRRPGGFQEGHAEEALGPAS